MRKLLFLIVIVVVAISGIIFGSINQQMTELHLLVISFPLRVVDVAVLFLVLGVLLGLLLAALYALGRRLRQASRHKLAKS
ncbi:DUF1049 domain-containing protein [Arsukibacterium sp.]|uniref:DUF1049 domain-containing protein n=1 Tax=Arsukibacterium sp. TaxID=1977258 RepID=UPI002FDA36B7